MIRYGFACKVIGIPGTAQKSLTLARATGENLLAVAKANLAALDRMLDYCRREGLGLMRLSSDLIPLATHPEVHFDWPEHLADDLARLKAKIKTTGLRVSLHPGQYTVLNSPRPEVLERSIADLVYHTDLLEALGADASAVIVLHLGGVYGDKVLALKRLEANLRALPDQVRSRLALENDDRLYNIEEVLTLSRKLALLAVFDVFHHRLNPPARGGAGYWLDRALAAWPEDRGRPKIHYSQQLPGARGGLHSKTIETREFLAFHASLGPRELDVMLEVKDKNLSALKCANLAAVNPPRKNLTEEWARYKYLVLEHGPAQYQAVRELLKSARPGAESFYTLIEEALSQDVSPGRAQNAARHVWGYLDRLAAPNEARRVLADLEAIATDPKAPARVKRKLLALAEAHKIDYLLDSLYFYL